MVEINATINGGIPSGSTVDSGDLGTLSGGTTTQNFTIDNVTDDETLPIREVTVYTDSTSSFSQDYEYSYTWSQFWDDSAGHMDINVEVTLDNDPGDGNDLTLDYRVRS